MPGRLNEARPAAGCGKNVAHVHVSLSPVASLVQSSLPLTPEASLKLHVTRASTSEQAMAPRVLVKLPVSGVTEFAAGVGAGAEGAGLVTGTGAAGLGAWPTAVTG